MEDQEYYIWRTRDDNNVRSHHAEREGMIFQWSKPPKGGHPGAEPNCRCWAEPLWQKEAYPHPKPNCKAQKEELNKAEENLKNLLIRQEEKKELLSKLVAENNNLIQQMQKTLGIRIATILIEMPIQRLGFISEILQNIIGIIVTDEVTEHAESFGIELKRIRQNVEYQKGQLQIIFAEIENTESLIAEKEKALKMCIADLPVPIRDNKEHFQ